MENKVKIMMTGANGHLGIRLMRALNETRPDDNIVALVRSEKAAGTVSAAGVKADIRMVDYGSAADLAAAGDGCDAIVNLVGIIKESRTNSFKKAHEDACQALVDANLKVSRLVSLSIVGSRVQSTNACLASRANADEILLNSGMPVTVLRVPMVLGPGDYASMALSANARKSTCFTFRAGSLEQPIYSEDVVTAILQALNLTGGSSVLELAGPESLSRRDLIQRAGRLFNNSPRVISLPIWVGMVVAGLMETVSANPPVTRAMLGVLDHDDDIDSAAALTKLEMKLTSLDDMLKAVLG